MPTSSAPPPVTVRATPGGSPASPQRDPFSGLADPTRRAILELLREDGVLAAGTIATHFPQVSRAAISKHLRVLRECGLVRSREIGRERHYTLQREPFLEIYQQWIAPFIPAWEAGLQQLKRSVEADEVR